MNKYMVKGFVFLALSMVGLLIPVIPQVPFFLVAMAYFSKGSPRFHNWLTGRKIYKFTVKMIEKNKTESKKYAAVK